MEKVLLNLNSRKRVKHEKKGKKKKKKMIEKNF